MNLAVTLLDGALRFALVGGQERDADGARLQARQSLVGPLLQVVVAALVLGGASLRAEVQNHRAVLEALLIHGILLGTVPRARLFVRLVLREGEFLGNVLRVRLGVRVELGRRDVSLRGGGVIRNRGVVIRGGGGVVVVVVSGGGGVVSGGGGVVIRGGGVFVVRGGRVVVRGGSGGRGLVVVIFVVIRGVGAGSAPRSLGETFRRAPTALGRSDGGIRARGVVPAHEVIRARDEHVGLRDDDSHQVELRLVFFVARGVHDVAVRALAGFVLLGAEKIKRSGFRLVSRLKVRHEHLDLRLEVFDLLVVRVRVRDTLLVRGDRVRRGLLGFRELVIQLRDGLIGLDESQVQFVLAFLRLLKLVKHVLVLVLEIGDDLVVVRAREVVRRTAVPDSEERVARRDDLRVKRRDVFLQRKVFVRQILHLLYQVGDLFRGEAFEGGRWLGGVLVAEMRAVRRTRGGHGPHGGIVGNAERRASRRRRVHRGGRRHDEHGADARGDDAVLHPARRRAGIAGFAEHQRRGLIRGRSACRHRERRSVVLERISYC